MSKKQQQCRVSPSGRLVGIAGAALLLLVMTATTASGGIPIVSDLMVTDVTPRSFSVVWASSEPSMPSLIVFDDQNGISMTVGVSIYPQPVTSGDVDIASQAEDNGVMKVTVTGLTPGSTYYFQTVTTSKSTYDVTYQPAVAPLPSVTTESKILRVALVGSNLVPVNSDLVEIDCYLPDGTTPAIGTLVVATAEGARHPISVFVGDGAPSPTAIVDLNNFFGRADGQTLDLDQGKNLTLVNFRGLLGASAVCHRVPALGGLGEIKPPDPFLLPGWNMVSLPVEPDDPAVDQVLAPIWSEFQSVWSYSTQLDRWLRYDRTGPVFLNDLNSMEAKAGYWLFMNAATSLQVHGSLVDETTVPIYAGWNLIGPHSIETEPIGEVIPPIESVLSCMWEFEAGTGFWKRYCPSGPPFLNDLQSVQPGRAYWIQATGEAQW